MRRGSARPRRLATPKIDEVATRRSQIGSGPAAIISRVRPTAAASFATAALILTSVPSSLARSAAGEAPGAGSEFWTSLFGALIGTVAGGVVAGAVAYHLTRRTASAEASYDIVHRTLSDEFTQKRRLFRGYVRETSDLTRCIESSENDGLHFQARQSAISCLNHYELVMRGVDSRLLKDTVIRSALWEIIKDDHDLLDGFLDRYVKANPEKCRPLFPTIRKYRRKWG